MGTAAEVDSLFRFECTNTTHTVIKIAFNFIMRRKNPEGLGTVYVHIRKVETSSIFEKFRWQRFDAKIRGHTNKFSKETIKGTLQMG